MPSKLISFIKKIFKISLLISLLSLLLALYTDIQKDSPLLGKDSFVAKQISQMTSGRKNVTLVVSGYGKSKNLFSGDIDFSNCKENIVNNLSNEVSKRDLELPLGELRPLVALSPTHKLCEGILKASNWIRSTNNNQYRYVLYIYHHENNFSYDGNSNFSSHYWDYNNVKIVKVEDEWVITIEDKSGLKYDFTISPFN